MKKLVVLLSIILLIFTYNITIGAEINVGSVPQKVDDIFIKNVQEITVNSWVTNLEIPWQLTFLPEDRALVTERKGTIRLIVSGKIQKDPYSEIDVEAIGEGGLLGMAYHKDGYVYIMYTYRDNQNRLYNRVSRLKDRGDIAGQEEIILDKIPAGRVHNGGRIAFGPDNKLYVTTGDTWNREIAQDLNSLGGKILRINPDGSIPEDNPFENSYIYSLGHRNPQGLAWHPKTGHLFISDHGPSGEEGLRGRDQIKVIKPGGNYGWPNSIGYIEDNKYMNPLIMWIQPTPPSGITFYKNDLYIATLRSRSLIKVSLKYINEYNYEVNGIKRLFSEGYSNGEYGRLRDVVIGEDNNLYMLTSNRDGRGNPNKNDDQIFKIIMND